MTESNDTFNITVGEFNGPLSKLLEFVEKRKLSITDISLAQVADDYIQYTKSLSRIPTIETAQFLVIAATLLLIKSKALLPQLILSDDEEASIKDLEERLALHKIYKDAELVLLEYMKSAKPLHAPRDIKIHKVVFAPGTSITSESLQSAMESVLSELPKAVIKKEAVHIESTVSIQERMDDILQRAKKVMSQDFNNLSDKSRGDVLLSFLALLELVKDGLLNAEQEGEKGDITVSLNHANKVHYTEHE